MLSSLGLFLAEFAPSALVPAIAGFPVVSSSMLVMQRLSVCHCVPNIFKV